MKVKIQAEIELGNAEMQTVEQAMEEVINTLTGRAVVFEGQEEPQKTDYVESLMDINGNVVGRLTLEVL